MTAPVAITAAIVAALVLATLRRRRRPVPYPARLAFLLDIPVPGLRHAPASLVRRLALDPGMRVLEIGPGSGHYTASLLEVVSASRLVCLDVQLEMLQKLRKRFGSRAPTVVCGDASALPFRPGSFDRIVMVTVLGEVPDRVAALRECARVLSDGATLVVAEALIDPDYVPARTLIGEAGRAGLAAVGRSGSWASYTQVLSRGGPS